jgi:ABC-type branched-subunit amino acid transport system substrate-binding protein
MNQKSRINRIGNWFKTGIFSVLALGLISSVAFSAVKIGLNYPESGPYSGIGLDQYRGVQLALSEINKAGGILGQQVELITADTKSNAPIAVANAEKMIDQDDVKMILGGASSGVAVAVGKKAAEKKRLFLATVTASNATTDIAGQRYMFRASYNAWMGAVALGDYLKKKYTGKKYFFITSDYTWGWSTEESIRTFTNTADTTIHERALTKLGTKDFKKELMIAKMKQPDVLVLILFGQDMQNAIRQATIMGLKDKMEIIVPIIELSMAEGAGPKIMEGVVGTSDYNWQVPYKYNYAKGKQFVEDFKTAYDRYPCWGAATAYTNVWEWKNAVERAKSFDSAKVVTAMEGHSFSLLKNEQTWRDFDHQNVQDVYLVKMKPAKEIVSDVYGLDYFDIINKIDGKKAVRTREQWNKVRTDNNLPTSYGNL